MTQTPGRFVTQRPERQHELRWNNPSWFIMRALRQALAAELGRLPGGEGEGVLDFGCANQPYRGLIPQGMTYLGADLPGNPHADVQIQPDGRLPLDDNTVSAVMSTQVLEHVEDPAAYVAEAFRVLKPGGQLILTTHGLWIYHRDPVDYWRWTADGLCLQLQRGGFEIERVSGLMGLAAVAVQLFQDATLGHLPRLLRGAYGFVLQRLVALFDRLHSAQSRRHNAMVYVVVARKP